MWTEPATAGGKGGLAPIRKIGPLGGAVARVFPNVLFAMCPPKTLWPPYLLDSGAGTVRGIGFFTGIGTCIGEMA